MAHYVSAGSIVTDVGIQSYCHLGLIISKLSSLGQLLVRICNIYIALGAGFFIAGVCIHSSVSHYACASINCI